MSELVACPACTALIAADASFCTHCGKATAVAIAAGKATPKRRAQQMHEAKRAKDVRTASRWILALGVIFVLFGTFIGIQSRKAGANALELLSHRADDEVVEIEGESKTIAEVRDAIRGEMVLPFVVNYLLAAVFIGLWFWSRKAPLPATVTALCIYLAVQVFNGIVDPTTLMQGLIVKIICILGLLAGVRAALAHRAAPPPPAAA